MHTARLNTTHLKAGLLIVTWLLVLYPSTIKAESYIAGQFGVTLPSIGGKGLSNQELTSTSVSGAGGTVTFPSGTQVSDQSLKSSFLFGAKLGHFFSRYRWLGVETEVFHTTPHIKQQEVTLTAPGPVIFTPSGGGPPQNLGNQFSTAGGFQGAHFRVITWAPLNFIFRYPGNRLQPYVGIGPGVFFGRISTSVPSGPDSQSSTTVGLNTQVGLRYHLTRHVSMFGEWKYNYARFNFKENDNFFGVKSTYSMNHFAFGLAYHF